MFHFHLSTVRERESERADGGDILRSIAVKEQSTVKTEKRKQEKKKKQKVSQRLKIYINKYIFHLCNTCVLKAQ